MAKYKITSIPQARYGGVFNRNKKIMKGRRSNESSTDQEQPAVEVQNVAQPSYWNEMQSPVMTGKQCPPGKYEFNGECLTETEYIAASNQEQAEAENKLNQRRSEWASDLEKLKEENQRKSYNLYQYDLDQYFKTFDASKKSDKIEPFEVFPLSNLNKETEEELKKQFLIHKNSETGQAELYPLNVAYDRIVNNGFQADQFKNYWGIDPKQVKQQLGPLMDAAKEQYDATVTNKIITKALEEGKSPAEVVKSLPSSLGNQTELKKFIKPTQKKLNDALGNITKGLDEIKSDDSQIAKDQDIFFSNDPQAAWEKRYHPIKTDLKYYSDKTERGQNAFNKWMDTYGDPNNPDIRYSQDDQMAMQRNANQLSRDAVILRDAEGKRTSAENQDYNTAVLKYLGNMVAPVQRDVLKKAISELNDNEKSSFINLYQTDPNVAVQSILGKKVPGSKQSYQDLLGEKAISSFTAGSVANRDQIKQGFSKEDPTTGDKVLDVLKHPFDATYFAMNPGKTMWDNKAGTYRQRVKDEDKLGIDLGTMPDYSPMWAMNQAVNVFNPFKIGMNLREGYDEGNFIGALGDELWDIGTAYGGMKGLGAIGKGTGFFKPILNALNNPLMNAGLLAQAPENFSNAYDELQAGNYGSAAWNGFLGVSGVAPAISAVRNLSKYGQTPTKAFNLGVTTPSGKYYGFKQMETPSKDLTYAINNQVLAEDLGVGLNNQRGYKSMMKQFHPDVSLYPQKIATDAAANLGSLRTVPKTTTMVPGFNRTYPTNINTGEIGIVESPMFNLGRNYKLNVGSNIFKPQTLEEILLRPRPESYNFSPSTKNNSSFNTQTLFKQNGGALPKANLGQIVKAGTKLTNAAKPAIYLMESPALRVTVPEFESLVNENLVKGLGIKKIDDQLKIKINPKIDSTFDLSGNPLLNLDMATYVGNNLTGNIGITRFDKGQHGIPTLEDQLIFMKEMDYPFGLSDRFNLMGTGVSGEFNKAITNSLQQVGLNPLVSSGMHTEEGRKRWDDLTEKGHATQLHKHFYMLHKNGGVALELTQKEIDQYIKDGYIIEDE